jgi:tRNA(Ile)-lysidine synthase
VAGLAAMPVCTPFGKGRMMRPLLAVSKAAILEYATEQQLHWVEDPTNQSSDFDRNFLRHQIVPLLKQRWPSLDKTVARSARHCGEAHTLLDAWARDAMTELIEPHDASLHLEKLTLYSAEQCKYLLRVWLIERGLKAPSEAALDAIIHQVIAARDDADPSLELQGFHLKRYRQRLVCLPSSVLEPLHAACHWPADWERVSLSQGGQCWRRSAKQGIAQRIWQQSTITLRPRQGGEKLKLPGRTGRHALKKLYQEAAIPPWERSIRPLVYIDDRLAAVAGLWVDEWACGMDTEPCYHIDWGYADPI